jgi:hypothetical protein
MKTYIKKRKRTQWEKDNGVVGYLYGLPLVTLKHLNSNHMVRTKPRR